MKTVTLLKVYNQESAITSQLVGITVYDSKDSAMAKISWIEQNIKTVRPNANIMALPQGISVQLTEDNFYPRQIWEAEEEVIRHW